MGSKRDKRRFGKATFDGQVIVGEVWEVDDMCNEDPELKRVDDVWMTNDEFEALPECTGF